MLTTSQYEAAVAQFAQAERRRRMLFLAFALLVVLPVVWFVMLTAQWSEWMMLVSAALLFAGLVVRMAAEDRQLQKLGLKCAHCGHSIAPSGESIVRGGRCPRCKQLVIADIHAAQQIVADDSGHAMRLHFARSITLALSV